MYRELRIQRIASGLLGLLLSLLVLAGCGGSAPSSGSPPPASPAPVIGPSGSGPGNTAQATARAYVALWEANDSARIDGLLTPEARQFWATGGGPAKWLTGKGASLGAPVAGQGQVLALTEKGGTAEADVAVVYDCQNAPCTSSAGHPAWLPAGEAVSVDHLTLQRQPDGTWLITWVDSSPYFARLAGATQTAVAAPSATAQVAAQQTADADYEAQAHAAGTAQAQSMIAAVATLTAQAPTATPVPVYTTAKGAYKLGVAADLQTWSGDAILFRVLDHAQRLNQYFGFDYNGDAAPAPGFAPSTPYHNGDGTSRQWLFYAASPTKKEVRVVRVLDGKIARRDVSAVLWRDLFAAKQITPAALALDTALDSDAVVKLAREHGYQLTNLANMQVGLSTEDLRSLVYKPREANWMVLGNGGKAVILRPQNGDVIENGF